MPGHYRAAIATLAALLLVSGGAALVVALAHDGGLEHRIRGLAGGGVTVAAGAILLRALFTGQGPRWLLRLLDEGSDID